MAQFDTVATIVEDVATEVGLGTVTVAYDSTDNHVLQLLKLLQVVGRALVIRNPWLQNRREYTFTTTSATTYALPADFQSMVDQTGWNRTGVSPLRAVTPQVWQYLKALPATSVVTVIFKPGHVNATGAPQLELLTANSGQEIAFEYRSRYWVADGAASAVSYDAPVATTDVVRLDSHLVTRALRMAFLRARGFPSQAAQEDFAEALEATRSANVNAAHLLRADGRRDTDRLLDDSNSPRSGYGFDAGGLFP